MKDKNEKNELNAPENDKKARKMNIFKILRPVSLILVMILLLVGFTNAWMKRDWTPTIKQDNIKISAGSSLSFVFQDEEIDEVTLNTLFGNEEFEFKSVSNSTGLSDHFFALDYGTSGELYATYKHIGVKEVAGNDVPTDYHYTQLGKQYGYIDMTFKVISPATELEDKAVYITDESTIKAHDETDELAVAAAKAVRIAVTVYSENGSSTTRIFASEAKNLKATTSEYIDGEGYVADGEHYYEFGADNKPTANVNEAYVKDGGALETFSQFNSDNPLFKLPKGEEVTMTVRIWLEGEDENCTNAIAGKQLDLLLQFAAKTVK